MDESSVDERSLQRPTTEDVKATWTAIFSDPLVSVPRLQHLALSKTGLGAVAADGGVTLRSVYWRIYHGLLPSPTSVELYPDALLASRLAYTNLRKRYLLAPDGRWASDVSPPLPEDESHLTPTAGPSRTSSPALPGEGRSWDPLSLESESPWKTWFAHLELRQTIRQDVDRTFPDIEYFKLERVRRCMVSILFLWAVLNPDVGYRQGMHELLAVCFWVIDRDTMRRPDTEALGSPLSRDVMEEAVYATLDARYVEHDAYALFAELMKSAKSSYEWRSEEMTRPRTTAQAQAPVITRCQHIHHRLIGRIDPQLWERLENEGVEAQIWAIRWIRLIFTRELPFAHALRLWDGIFAQDTSLDLLDFICVAMLLLIRNELIEADYPTLLTHLLHYPAPSSTYPFEPSLILSQAVFLRDNISPASGVEVVIQNQDVLGVKAQPPERSDTPPPVALPNGRAGPSSIRTRIPISQNQSHPQSRPGAGVQGFAQGWLERAQSAGLDKAVLSAVSDLRRNLPDTSAAYSYLPNLPFSPLSPAGRDGSFSSIPTSTSALPNRGTYFPRPTSSPSGLTPTQTPVLVPDPAAAASLQSRLLDQERQMAELRLAMVGMGKAMSGYLSSLGSEAGLESAPVSKSESIAGLSRVRDALLDGAGRDVESLVREWVWMEHPAGSSASASASDASVPPPPPLQHSQPPSGVQSPTPARPGFGPVPPPSERRTPAVPDSAPPSTSSHTAPKPPLHLSHRDVGPMTSLPRVPHTAPLGPTGRGGSQVPNPSTAPEGREKLTADPLAGLGVTPHSAPQRRPKGQGVSPFADPLGAGP